MALAKLQNEICGGLTICRKTRAQLQGDGGQNDLRLIEAAISIHVEDAEQEADLHPGEAEDALQRARKAGHPGNVVLARHHHHGTSKHSDVSLDARNRREHRESRRKAASIWSL